MITHKRANRKIQNQLKKLCKQCPTKEMGGCPYTHKHECPDCNVVITIEVLNNYTEHDLMSIPVSALINGLHAHRLSGELRKTTLVQI